MPNIFLPRNITIIPAHPPLITHMHTSHDKHTPNTIFPTARLHSNLKIKESQQTSFNKTSQSSRTTTHSPHVDKTNSQENHTTPERGCTHPYKHHIRNTTDKNPTTHRELLGSYKSTEFVFERLGSHLQYLNLTNAHIFIYSPAYTQPWLVRSNY
jgi:hypothetical protein